MQGVLCVIGFSKSGYEVIASANRDKRRSKVLLLKRVYVCFM